MALHGISVALVDSKPRELLQLNVREVELSGHTCDGVACLLQLRIRQLSLDNMIADTDSPVLLSSEPSALAPSLAHGEGEVPFVTKPKPKPNPKPKPTPNPNPNPTTTPTPTPTPNPNPHL